MFWLLSLVLSVAQAGNQNGKVKPYMRGMGVSVGTLLYPSSYPMKLPHIKDDIAAADGVTSPDFNQFRQDVVLGGKGTLFVSPKFRGSANPYAHLGFNDSNYRAYGIDLGVDYMAFRERNVLGYYGGGLGTQAFSFTDGGSGELSGTQNYLKAQAGLIYFEKRKAYELEAYVKLGNVNQEVITVGNSTYEQGGLTGSDDQLSTSLYSPTVGLQGTMYIGDFRKLFNKPVPPKKKNKAGKKKKQKKKQKKNQGRR
jgi:hypothetical protein